MRAKTQKKAGAAGKTSERTRYIQLTRKGMNNSEICRMLGIPRKTGSKWRNGYKHTDQTGTVRYYAPILAQTPESRRKQAISPRFLSEDERIQIADLRRAGQAIRAIAEKLNRSPSTISRELRRNVDGGGKYQPFHADKLARARRTRSRETKIAANPQLRNTIQELMRKHWSPAQISRHLRTTFAEDTAMQVVHETIYRDLYDWRGGALRRDCVNLLRTKRNRRKPSRLIPRRQSRFGPGVLMISDRPFNPTDRSIPGNWEGDLIMGSNNRSAIGTLVERTSRFTLLIPVDAANRAESLRDNLTARLLELPPHLRKSITWDQGWEMARHADITRATGASIYFCNPHSPWERGTNENTNRLLRDYFPKRTDLNLHSARMLAKVAAELNDRPRLILGWDTPARRFDSLSEAMIQT